MAAEFVTITKQQMHTVLTARGFVHTPNTKSLEYMYDRTMQHNGHDYTVRIFTSIDTRTDVSRKLGSDAIRLVVLDTNGKVVSKESRINRSEGWQYRLNARIDKWTENLHTCPQCKEGMLVKRKGKWGEFYGCSIYPRCGYTQKDI